MARFSFGVGQWLGGGDKLLFLHNGTHTISTFKAWGILPAHSPTPHFHKGEPAEKQRNPAGVSFHSANCPAEETSKLQLGLWYTDFHPLAIKQYINTWAEMEIKHDLSFSSML